MNYHLKGVGSSTNQLYQEDDCRKEAHEFEDRSFHFKIDDHIHLYGVFNGKDGAGVADFAAQRMPAEILLGQLNEKSNPGAVKEVLRDAFLAVERSYFESIDDLLAQRANLLCELPDGNIQIKYLPFENFNTLLIAVRSPIGRHLQAISRNSE